MPILEPANAAMCRELSELAMRSKAYWGYSEDFMSACRDELAVTPEKLANPALRYVIYRDQAGIAGFYALETTNPGTAEVEALFVEPSKIGSGIGGTLMKHAIESARAAGVQTLTIQSDPGAVGFYLAMGAIQVGSRESGSIPGRFLPLLQLHIRK